MIDAMSVDMKSVQRRKRLMVEGLHQLHLDRSVASGATRQRQHDAGSGVAIPTSTETVFLGQ
jgi:hypothetical protein